MSYRCCISYLLLAAPLFDLYIPPGLEILHNESVLELERSLGEEYLIIPQNREITLLGCCSSHSLLESHFMSTLFHSQFLLTTGSLQNNFIFVVCQLFTLPPPILADWSRLTSRKNKYQKERVNLASHFHGLNKI